MDRAKVQERIDAVEWYHDFDFGGGLSARTKSPDAEEHRRLWGFIEDQLAGIDFRGKSVLDVGCWDGYWSFYAEKRGAKSVLASDDATQNWAGSRGLLLAKELLSSRVESRLDLSVYDLASLGRTFDVILCLGVYYHLHDPFYALAQIRHCCHPGTVVVIEGNELVGVPSHAAVSDLRAPGSKYTPSESALRDLIDATYLRVGSEAVLEPLWKPDPPKEPKYPTDPLGWRWRFRSAWAALRGDRRRLRQQTQLAWPALPPTPALPRRVCWVCRPFEGANEIHLYRPPFGLHRYDSRWQAKAA